MCVCSVAMVTLIPGFDPMDWGHRQWVWHEVPDIEGVGWKNAAAKYHCLPTNT